MHIQSKSKNILKKVGRVKYDKFISFNFGNFCARYKLFTHMRID